MAGLRDIQEENRRRYVMGRTSTNPKKFIISCRVNHREMQSLQKRAEASGLSITMLLRKSLELAEREHGHQAARGRA
jgi:hypothetical protein